MFMKKPLDRAKEKEQKETPPLGPDGPPPVPLSLTPQPTREPPKVASTGTFWRYSSELSEEVPVGTAGLRPAAEGERGSPDPHPSETGDPSVPRQEREQTHPPAAVAGEKEYTAPTAAEFLEGMAATLAKAAKARAFKGYRIENQKTIASRYRRLDMQRAVLRGEIAIPKKGGK